MNSKFSPSRVLCPWFSAGFAFLLGSTAWATIYTVTSTDGGNTVAGSLRYIVDNQATDGDTINFEPSLNGQSINLTGSISIGHNLTIDASSLANGVTLTTSDGVRLFTINSGTSILKCLTLANGLKVSQDGGGVLNSGTLTMNQCTLTGNSSGDGGAIFNSGTLTLNQCTLTGNSASQGGGGAIETTGTLNVNQCTIVGNSTNGSGGGILTSNNPTVTITNSIIANNTDAGGSPDIANSAGAHLTFTGANWESNLNGLQTYSGPVPLTGNPLLAPLGNYGGPTQTMPPLVGSGVVNAAVGSTFTTDQRGLTITDGQPDLGAVEQILTIVTDTSDSDAGSLRQALLNAVGAGNEIGFSSSLSGESITVASTLSISTGMIVDAGNLSAGITLQGGGSSGSYGLISIPSSISHTSSILLKNLILTGGGGSNFGGNGGAISTFGTLTLTQCTLSGNSAGGAGALFVTGGTVTLNQCTLSGNSSSGNGGAIFYAADPNLTLNQCTLSGNTASGSGGAIFVGLDATRVVMNQCTVDGNSASMGGGVFNNNYLTLDNTIVANNTASNDPDIGGGGITLSGANWIGNLTGSGQTASSTLFTSDPMLSPLGNYGGLTQTMPPLPGSGVINAAVSPTFTTDQRGCPIVGTAMDLGAAECSILSPTPGEGAGISPSSNSLSWTGPAGASFQVYLGTSAGSLSLIASPGTTASASAGTLTAGDTYYWRVDSTIGTAVFTGPVFDFIAGQPSATTDAASTVSSAFATLNGMVNPGGQSTTAYFEYGTTTSYGSITGYQNLGDGGTAVPVSFNINSLAKGTTYHYQLVVVSGGTTYYGGDQTFTTPSVVSPPIWHSTQVTSQTGANPMPMADGARTGAAHSSWEVYFYKGTDNNIWCVYLNGSTWLQEQLTTGANVSDWLAFESTYLILCYKSIDGNLWCVYYDSTTAKWVNEQLGTLPQGVTIAGDIVVDTYNGWNNVYYRGSDSHLYAAYFNGTAWVHVAIGGTATVKGNLAVEGNNHLVYYQGTDNNIWCFNYTGTGSVWEQIQLTTTGNVGGTVGVDSAGLICYYKSSADNSAWCTYSHGGPTWTPEELDATANMSSSLTSFSNIAPYTVYDDTLYLDNNGQCDALYWNGSKWGHILLGDGAFNLTGGLSLQPYYHWAFARRSDGNVVIFFNQ